MGNIVETHGLLSHYYADDAQLWTDAALGQEGVLCGTMVNCIMDVESWMRSNYLKRNLYKTKFMLYSTKHNYS